MRVTKVIQHYLPSPNFGGTPIACDELTKQLIKEKIEVKVLTTDLYGPNRRSDKKNKFNYEVIRLKNLFNNFSYKFKFATPLFSVRQIRNVIENSDVIHFYEYRSILNVIFCLLKGKSDTKYIIQPHGTYKLFGTRKLLKNGFDFLFKKIIDKNMDYFIAISNEEKSIFLKNSIPKRKVKLIPNGITFKIYKHKTFKNYILYLGRIHQVKGIDKLIEAYGKTTLPKSGIKLIIAGNDDGYKKTCKNMVKKLKLKDSVIFKPAVRGEEKHKLLKEAILVSYVTQTEPFGLVPLEAAMYGTWSIVSSDSGLLEYVSSVSFCDKVKYGDINNLSKIIEEATKNKKIVKLKEIKKLQKIFDWKNIKKSWIELYKLEN